jgi:HSP20 family protein
MLTRAQLPMDIFSKHFGRLLASMEAMRPQAAWCPAADMHRCRHGWLVKFDLAGVRPEEIRLEISGRQLKVSGSRRDWTVTEAEEAHQLEIAYSHYERIVELPEPVGDSSVQTEYRDGMFLVQICTDAGHA